MSRPRMTPFLIGVSLVLALGFVSLLVPTGAAAREGRSPSARENTCAACHEETAEAFRLTIHGRAYDNQAAANECESCHGPGEQHIDDPQKTNIQNPSEMSGVDANEVCLTCHEGTPGGRHWPASRHAAEDVTCMGCHDVHANWTVDHALRKGDVNQTCFGCHPQSRKSMFQRSSHPLRTGQLQCTSCHDPHGSPGDHSLRKPTVNETCYTCHMDKRGPYLFEHSPVREDCLSCHVAHGSNNTMLLKAPTTRLCQSCHLLGHHQTVASQPGQIWVQNRACVNCHAQIHGSNHPSGAIFLR